MRSLNPRTRASVALLAAFLALATLISPVSAGGRIGGPRPLVLEMVERRSDDPSQYIHFFVNVNHNPYICAFGAQNDRDPFEWIDNGDGTADVTLGKELVCPRGSVYAVMHIHIDFNANVESTVWEVTGGTGPYADLRGTGTSGNPKVIGGIKFGTWIGVLTR
jgi:hypothetical protein